MAKPKTLVDYVSSLSVPPEIMAAKIARPPSGLVNVHFSGGQSGFLDMAEPRSTVWAEVLDSLRQTNQPAYVEIDPETNIITELHVPVVVSVAAIHPIKNTDDVEHEHSLFGMDMLSSQHSSSRHAVVPSPFRS